MPAPLLARVAAAASEAPREIAVVEPDGSTVSFAELTATASHLAGRIGERGLAHEEPVGVAATNVA